MKKDWSNSWSRRRASGEYGSCRHAFIPTHASSSEDRVRAGAARLDKMLNQKQQGRLDGFFKVTPKEKPVTGSAKDTKKTAGKRKVSVKCLILGMMLT